MGKFLAGASLLLVVIIIVLSLGQTMYLFRSHETTVNISASIENPLDYDSEQEKLDLGYVIADLNHKQSPTGTSVIPDIMLNKWISINNLTDYKVLPSRNGSFRDKTLSFTAASYNFGNFHSEYINRNGKTWSRVRETGYNWSEWKELPDWGVNEKGRNQNTGIDLHLLNDYRLHYTRAGKVYFKILDLNFPNDTAFYDVTSYLKNVGRGRITNFTQTRLHTNYTTAQYLTQNGKVYTRSNPKPQGWTSWEELTPKLNLKEIAHTVRVNSYDTAMIPGGYTQEYLTTNRGEVYVRYSKNNPAKPT